MVKLIVKREIVKLRYIISKPESYIIENDLEMVIKKKMPSTLGVYIYICRLK